MTLLSHLATPVLTTNIPVCSDYSYITLSVIFNNDPAEETRVSELEMSVKTTIY